MHVPALSVPAWFRAIRQDSRGLCFKKTEKICALLARPVNKNAPQGLPAPYPLPWYCGQVIGLSQALQPGPWVQLGAVLRLVSPISPMIAA